VSAQGHPEQPRCPACKTGAAVAFVVYISKGTATLTYRCADCGHEWAVTKPYSPAAG
jgi:hypothetical protein